MKRTALIFTALLGVAMAEDKAPAKPAEAAKPTEPVKAGEPAKLGDPVTPADPAKPAAPAVAEQKVFIPTDLEGLKAAKGQKVLVEGTIAGSGANKGDTIRYLNFTKDYKQSVALVIFASSGGAVFTKEKAAEFVGKKVRVTGELSEHNGALQIKLEKLDQVTIQP